MESYAGVEVSLVRLEHGEDSRHEEGLKVTLRAHGECYTKLGLGYP